ncbi:MAG: tape measure protein, partial [Prochlorococcaceae cyanobacterium]
MAESLGRATFDVLLDTSAFRAGIEQVRTLAQRAGQSIEGALGAKASKGSLAALDIRINSLKEEIRLVDIGSKKYKELAAEIRKATQERQRADAGQGDGFGPSLGKGIANLAGIAGVTVGFAGVAAGISGAVKAAVEFETITRKLQNTLGTGGAADALQFVKGLSDRLGLSYKQLANDFGSFTAAASAANVPLEQQQAVFQAVAQSGQALGLSSDAVSGSLLAIQQVASKGTVQMEELRGQLGERLPIAFSATARGLGITQQELNKLVESGQLTASEFFPALAKGLNELTSGAGGSLTAAQQFAVLGNAWEELQISLGETLLPTVIGSVDNLADALKFAADNTKVLVQVLAGVGAASAAFYVLANATKVVTTAQKALAVAAAIAQTILNPANALKVAAALAVGAATAVAVGAAIDNASGSQGKLGQ